MVACTGKLDAPASDGWTLLKAEHGGGGNGSGCVDGLAFALTPGHGESGVVVVCLPVCVIRRFASRWTSATGSS